MYRTLCRWLQGKLALSRLDAMPKRTAENAFAVPGKAITIDLPSGVTSDQRPKSSYFPRFESEFVSICSVNGKVVAVPLDAKKILVVDPASYEVFTIDLPKGIGSNGLGKFFTSCLVDGKVVAVPYNADKILVVDPALREAYAIDLPSEIDIDSFGELFRSCCLVDGKVVAVPYDADKILVVDPALREAFVIDLPSGIDSERCAKFRSSCSVNGQVVAVPWSAEKILVVDLTAWKAFAFGLPSSICVDNETKFQSSCLVNGKVVARYHCDEDRILVVDPELERRPKMIFSRRLCRPLGWGEPLWNPCVDVNGKLVAIPRSRNQQNILLLDGSVPASVQGEKEAKHQHFAPSCLWNGRPVAVPRFAKQIPQLPTALDLHLHASDVHNSLQFVDLVAAMLSCWVYSEDPKPPKMAHASFHVRSRNRLGPCDLGKPMKIAVVSADLPMGRTVFIVLASTAGILDFGRMGLEYDHPDTTAENECLLVNDSVSKTVVDIITWKGPYFMNILKGAAEEGAQSVVFAGHSVGGMYAQLCLFWAYKQLLLGNERFGSLYVRSITFGAPMLFGGGSQKLGLFKDFAKDCAVNYIHANDPCPRAWSALDLRKFVATAAAAVNCGLQDVHGSLKGTLGSKVVESMASQFLERSDFHAVEDRAKKYKHVVPLKVLGCNKDHQSWRDFRLMPESFVDHSVVAYVNKLFDAFDHGRPECYVHVQTDD